MKPEWEQCLARWLGELEVGAELEVRDPDGTVVFLAPLARHYRVDPDDGVLWVRPIVGGYAPTGAGMPPYAFHLNEARARALATRDVAIAGDELVLVNDGGQIAHIRRAGPQTRPELDRWDDFVYLVLSATEEAALDEVWGDSYYGDWA
jgi:hypothetical protein